MKKLFEKINRSNIFIELVDGKLKLRTSKDISPDLLDEIKSRKEEIIRFLVESKQDGIAIGTDRYIPKVAEQLSYPLSSSQRSFWLLSSIEESSVAYNSSVTYSLEGILNLYALKEAFSMLIERHEILRTVFKENEEYSINQFILPFDKTIFTLQNTDLRNEADKNQKVSRLVLENNQLPFDLSCGPLLRTRLYQVEDDKWILSYVMHHIISDGWSMDVLMNDLRMLYNTKVKGETESLAPLRIQYKDYASWQHEQLNCENFKRHREYWLKQFEDEIPVLELVGDCVRPAVKTFTGGTIQRIINSELSKKLKQLGQEQGGTLFMALLAAVNTLLYKYTNQEDIIIGSPAAGRVHEDLHDQIGAYINTLALRTQFKGEQSFSNLFQKVKQITFEGNEHQAYPFDELIDKLSIRRDVSRNPLFDVMMTLENAGISKVKDQVFENLRITEYKGVEVKTSQLDLSFDFIETGEEIQANINYSSDIYDSATVERLSDHLIQLIEQLVKNPDLPLKEINFLSVEEKEVLLEKFNDTNFNYPKDKTLIELFEEQVFRVPDTIALVFEEKKLSYNELNEKANELANYLRDKYKIKADDLIGIMLDRSEWMVIGIVGILKSGAAYVPIDPDYPKDRIDYMISDSQCKIVLDEYELELFKNEKKVYGTENIASINKPTDLAYVIYTSGSTGQPKGVMVEHRSVVNIHFAWQREYGLDVIAVNLLQLASISFDVFMGDFCRSLLNGGKMIICSNEIKLHPENLFNLLEQQNISILEGTPGLLLPLIDHMVTEKKITLSLKMIIFGSDFLSKYSYDWVQKNIGNRIRIINSYGTTETAIDSTYYEEKDSCYITTNTPIGKAFSNTQLYVLNERCDLLPIGVLGEICIGGDGLTRGYLNKQELTAEKFVANPFKSNKQIYKTGDLGRWLPDGNVEFIGRKDDQVKIRGYRIELGEIETALQKYAYIESAIVTAKKNKDGDNELIAYVVGNPNLNIRELQSHLRTALPAYMVPGYFVKLAALPLTANGKINKKGLPDPEGILLTSVEYVAPKNEIEKKLIEIWSELLSVNEDKIGIKDDFFDCGGHSLKATRLSSRIHKEFDVKISLNELFTTTILEEQASLIALGQWRASYKHTEESLSDNSDIHTF